MLFRSIPDAEYDLVHVVLERDVTYELQVTRVGIGTEVEIGRASCRERVFPVV